MKVVVISGNGRINQFMHLADVFESFKMFAWPQEFEMAFDGKEPPFDLILEYIKKTCEEKNHCLAAAFMIGDPSSLYRNPDVKAISDGKRWAMLDDVLEKYGMHKKETKDDIVHKPVEQFTDS